MCCKDHPDFQKEELRDIEYEDKYRNQIFLALA